MWVSLRAQMDTDKACNRSRYEDINKYTEVNVFHDVILLQRVLAHSNLTLLVVKDPGWAMSKRGRLKNAIYTSFLILIIPFFVVEQDEEGPPEENSEFPLVCPWEP